MSRKQNTSCYVRTIYLKKKKKKKKKAHGRRRRGWQKITYQKHIAKMIYGNVSIEEKVMPRVTELRGASHENRLLFLRQWMRWSRPRETNILIQINWYKIFKQTNFVENYFAVLISSYILFFDISLRFMRTPHNHITWTNSKKRLHLCLPKNLLCGETDS